MLVLVDTGILLRLLDRADPEHLAIRRAVRVSKQRGDRPVAVPQNVAEFWNVCTRPASARGGYGLTVEETAKRLRLLERLVQVLPDTTNYYPFWKALVVAHAVKGVQVHDARLAAFMQAHGISHLLTLNGTDFTRYSHITVLAPSDFP
jgi:predicted nucleic acid-binding protein